MKLRVVVCVLVCAAGAFLVITNSSANSASEQAESHTATLPQALDNFYPPASPAPQYLLSMIGMARSLSGTVCDAQENDLDNARLNFETFKQAYLDNSVMIPEWKDKYPIEPVNEMGAALASGDPARIMPAVDAVGAICHQCHVTFMPLVQQKYRWDSFAGITSTDPLSKQKVGYAQLMLMMQTNFDGIGNDLGQGQIAAAVKQFEGFQARFSEMGESCIICHDSERKYYVSDDITEKIAKLGEELHKTDVNPGAVGALLQEIGQENCSKCHLVHIPAAYGQQLLTHR